MRIFLKIALRPYKKNYLFIIPARADFSARPPVFIFSYSLCACANSGVKGVVRSTTTVMPFVVLQIRAGAKLLKRWYGCVVAETTSVADVFGDFSSGALDGGNAIPDEYRTAVVDL